MSGRVVLVGAGPGDPDLLTLRALRELEQAEVLLYDALIDPALLEFVPDGCERIDVGKRGDGSRGVSQEAITELIVSRARSGQNVVRLKGGDPFVFGRGGEEAERIAQAGIPFEIVPGVSSAWAVPAYAGIPVTDRRLSSSVAVVTGHRGKSLEDTRVDWEGLACSAETLVILMGTRWLEDIVARVIAGGRDPRTPAAVIAGGTTPRQRVVTADLEALPARVREAGLLPPTVIVIGRVARLRESLRWFERRSLFGRRVLVARAEGQRGELSRELRRRGAEPVPVPLLAFEPPEDRERLVQRLAKAHEYDWLVFTSANAVRFCAPLLSDRGRPGPRVACVGSATAAAAAAAGLRVQVIPPGPFRPPELVRAMVAHAPLSGARVLFPRGDRAGPSLREALESAGARLEDVVAYRTVLPEGAGRALERTLQEGIDAVTLTSPSSIDHLFSLLDEAGLRPRVEQTVFACIGPTTAARLAAHGFEAQVVAGEQTAAALAGALERFFSEHRDVLS
ncbi:MAG: uroporphyrinogen-III C-methyltransferase [Myxococcota bacterium]